ncbi:MAG: motility associated factor glycosyltransferase family protein [Spirochaetes bacterium]|nr:motility associated factor glycosyltransferase family protein [Spirochaetota bacterium]
MNSFYGNNVESLKKNNDFIDFERLSGSDSSCLEPVQSRTGAFVPVAEIDGKKTSIHSKYDPQKEAERFLSDVDTSGSDLYIVFGFGYGFHVEILLKSIRKDASILIIEKNYYMLKSAFENRDLSSLLGDERVLLLADPDEDTISMIMKGKSSHKMTFILHRGSCQIDNEYYGNISRVVKSYLSTKEVNIATLAKFEKLWNSNIARNINALIDYQGVNNFYGKFSGFEAIIIGAGPSLSDSMDFLRKNRSSRILIAVDTAYSILVRNGIIPHFTLCVDPQVVNARYFEDFIESDTVLVTDPTVHPSVLRFFTGKKIISSPAFDTLKWIEKHTGEKGEITHGGSVSTNAYDFARRLGVDRIYLTGQDLSFTGYLAHAKGSYLDEQIHNHTYRLKNQEMFNINQLRALPPVYIESIAGGKVRTNQKMIIFLNWFEKRNDDSLYNASAAGAKIRNAPGIKQKDVPDLPEKDIAGMIHGIFNKNQISGNAAVKSEIFRNISMFENEITSLSERLDSAVRFSEELLQKFYSNDKKRISEIIRRLDLIDEYISGRVNAKDMIGLSVQKVIHTVTEGYDIDDEKDEKLKSIKKSLFLYKGLKEGSRFNLKILAKMKCLIS